MTLPGGGDVTQDAVLLACSFGLGHEMMARSRAGLLEQSGWRTRRLDDMSMLGSGAEVPPNGCSAAW
jgi:hypothetical protein